MIMDDGLNWPALTAALDRLGQPRVLVLGDLILDRYTWGDAERVSQEAPVILLRADQREVRLGGAANVCNMLRGLGARVDCAGVVGNDADGSQMRAMLEQQGVETWGVIVDPARPTTVKERFIGRAQGRHAHQMLRVDSEVRAPLAAEHESHLVRRLSASLADYDVVLISDYDKGVCTPGLLGRLLATARAAGVPVLVDPIRGTDFGRYRLATTMTPNRLEAGLATGLTIRTPDDAFAAGRRLREQLELDVAIVTLDRDGMALVTPDHRGRLFGTRPRAVYDITGAGDMALAMIGMCAAARLSWPDTLRLANVAAGLEVEKVGVAVVPLDEIRGRLREEQEARQSRAAPAAPASKVVEREQIARRLAKHRQAGERIVFTNGCFDLLHVGHVACLTEARAQGEILVVGLNSDASVRRLKGASRPVVAERERATLLGALACIDYVVTFEEDTPLSLIEQVRPDVLMKGGGYEVQNIVGRELVESYGGRVGVTTMVDGVSTTRILARLQEARVPQPHFNPSAAARREA